MAIDTYDLDPDVIAISRKNAREQIPTNKSSMSGKNPQLQAEEEYNYDTDPDVLALSSKKVVTPEEKEKSKGGFLPSWLKGGGEAALHTIASGISIPASAVAGIYGTLTSGKFGTQEGIRAGEAVAKRVQEKMQSAGTQPTTEEGKSILEGLQSAFEASKAPPIFPEGLGLRGERELAGIAGQGAKAQLQAQFGGLKPKISIERAPSGLQSGGAMATSNPAIIKGNIDSALAEASPELQAYIQSHPPENINLPALETRVLEEKHGINLTVGQRTGDTNRYAQEHNRRGETEKLTNYFKDQPVQIGNAFEKSKLHNAPDIPSTADASELGQHEINGLAETDSKRLANIDNAYKNFRDVYVQSKKDAGLPVEHDFPVNGKEFLNNTNKALINESLQFDVPESISKLLNVIKENNGKMNYQEFLNLDKRLSAKQREGLGSERAAAGVIRKQLNNIELADEASALNPLYQNAKGLAKERFDVIENNPAYASAIDAFEDAKSSKNGVSLMADKFHKKFVSSGSPESIRRLKEELPQDHIAHQAMTFAELEKVKNAATNALTTRVKTDSFADFLRNNASNLKESLSPEAFKDVMEIGLLNSKMAKPDAGVFNYSNSYSSLIADLAKQGVLGAVEMKLAGATGGASIPVVGFGKQLMQKHNKDSFATEAINPKNGLTKSNATDIGTIQVKGQP